MDVLDKPGGLEAVLFEELQSIADAECFHYEMEDLGCAPFTNEPIPPVTMVTTFVAGCAPTTKTHK
jgi:hypothetical protein